MKKTCWNSSDRNTAKIPLSIMIATKMNQSTSVKVMKNSKTPKRTKKAGLENNLRMKDVNQKPKYKKRSLKKKVAKI
jgi:hypothetical protein